MRSGSLTAEDRLDMNEVDDGLTMPRARHKVPAWMDKDGGLREGQRRSLRPLCVESAPERNVNAPGQQTAS